MHSKANCKEICTQKTFANILCVQEEHSVIVSFN